MTFPPLTDILHLEVPLVWCDTETTGTVPKIDYIVQVGIIKYYPDGRVKAWDTLVRPPIAIPPEAIEVHGITDDAVKEAPTFQQIAPRLAEGFKLCDFGGYNAPFDWRMFRAEFERCGIRDVPNGRMVDPNKIFHKFYRRNLEAALLEYCGEERARQFAEGAHNAAIDIAATVEVFFAQLQRHQDLPRDVGAIHRTFFEDDLAGGAFYWRYGKATFSFGKHIGESLEQVAKLDNSYLTWILSSDFGDDVKQIVRNARAGKFPVKLATTV